MILNKHKLFIDLFDYFGYVLFLKSKFVTRLIILNVNIDYCYL